MVLQACFNQYSFYNFLQVFANPEDFALVNAKDKRPILNNEDIERVRR